MAERRSKFYSEKAEAFAAGAQRPELDLAGAAALAGLQAEIELLRALVKRAVQGSRDEEARRLVLALCGTLRLQRTLIGELPGDPRQILEDLLQEIGLNQKSSPESKAAP